MRNLFDKGTKHWNSKLNTESVKSIKNMLVKGFKIKEIAEKFQVHAETIRDIDCGRTWKHVGEVLSG